MRIIGQPRMLEGALILEIEGLRPFYGFEGQNACIDASIAPLVLRLNEMGFETWVSCSGLPEDHPGDPFPTCRAYICFRSKVSAPLAQVLKDSGFYLEGGTAAYMRKSWQEFPTAESVRSRWYALAVNLNNVLVAKS